MRQRQLSTAYAAYLQSLQGGRYQTSLRLETWIETPTSAVLTINKNVPRAFFEAFGSSIIENQKLHAFCCYYARQRCEARPLSVDLSHHVRYMTIMRVPSSTTSSMALVTGLKIFILTRS
jgi:hypothetical protein